ASTSACAFAPGSMPVCDWKSAIRVMVSGREQRVELAGPLERDQVVAAPDVPLADEDLGNRHPSLGALDHHLLLGPTEIDHDLPILDALRGQQVLGAPAIGTGGLGVDFDGRHG